MGYGTCAITNLPILENEPVVLYVMKHKRIDQFAFNNTEKVKTLEDFTFYPLSSFEILEGLFDSDSWLKEIDESIKKKLDDRHSKYCSFYIKKPVYEKIQKDRGGNILEVCLSQFKPKMRDDITSDLIRQDPEAIDTQKLIKTLTTYDKIDDEVAMQKFDSEFGLKVFHNWQKFVAFWNLLLTAYCMRIDLYAGDLFGRNYDLNLSAQKDRVKMIQTEIKKIEDSFEETED